MAHAVVRIADVYVVGVAGAADEFARDTCIHFRDAATQCLFDLLDCGMNGISCQFAVFDLSGIDALDRFSDDVDDLEQTPRLPVVRRRPP